MRRGHKTGSLSHADHDAPAVSEMSKRPSAARPADIERENCIRRKAFSERSSHA